jgi:hypothetical protein
MRRTWVYPLNPDVIGVYITNLKQRIRQIIIKDSRVNHMSPVLNNNHHRTASDHQPQEAAGEGEVLVEDLILNQESYFVVSVGKIKDTQQEHVR